MDYKEFFTSLFLWLKERETQNGGVFSRAELQDGFYYQGLKTTLIGPRGIWVPKGFEVPVSITTTFENPYRDGLTVNDLIKYHYQGSDPDNRDNHALRNAFRENISIVYFDAIKPGRYQAVYPVQIISDYPDLLYVEAVIEPSFHLGTSVDSSDAFINDTGGEVFSVRRYMTRTIKYRLHQNKFREFVLDAYSRSCTICKLKHTGLLDAAHIIPDAEEAGEPIVPNGLSLCKIHHSAYDQNIIGITPDYSLRVRGDVLDETDGPMLEWGLKKLEGQKIVLPRREKDYPDKERLAKRFEEFGKVG